jgi:hypothetical protein
VGDQLIVHVLSSKKEKGRLSAVSEGSLTLTRNGRSTEIAKVDIVRIYRLIPGRRGKAGLMGAVIGGGIGGGVGAYWRSHGDFTSGGLILVVAVGAGIGALIGSFAGLRHEEVLIYATYPPA